MPNVAQGATASYTFPTAQTVTFTLDQGERAVINVTRSGSLIANRSISNGETVGPYQAGDVMAVTALRGAVDYDVATYTSPASVDGGAVGPYADTTALQAAYPAADYPGLTAYVGASAPYTIYQSDGQAWGTAGAAATFEAGAVVQGAGRFAGHQQFRGESTDSAARVYLMPNGEPSGTTGAVKIFLDDYYDTATYAAGDNYRDFGLYADRDVKGPNGAGSFFVNSKVNADFGGANPQIAVASQDGNRIPMRMVTVNTAVAEATMATWAAACIGRWRSGIAVTAGQTVYASNGKGYTATTSGTTGTTKPSHGSGTASDGGVTWQFDFDNAAAAGANIASFVMIGDKTDFPWYTGSEAKAARLHLTRDVALYNARYWYFLSSTGAAVTRMYVAPGTSDLYFNDPTGQYGMRIRTTATGFRQNQNLATLLANKAISDNSATPNVSAAEHITFSNSSATNVTSFTGGLGWQYLVVSASNSNTTLVHSSSLRLVGDANKVLTANSRLMFVANSAGTAFTEVGYL